MEKYNLVVVLDKERRNILMCKREKSPYEGLYNFVGGKVESDNYLEEAYRELEEETGISKKDTNLEHVMDLRYQFLNLELQVFFGYSNANIELKEEVNILEWISIDEDFWNKNKFAGEGNIYHIINVILGKESGI